MTWTVTKQPDGTYVLAQVVEPNRIVDSFSFSTAQLVVDFCERELPGETVWWRI